MEGDLIWLMILSMNDMMIFGNKDKISLRFISLFDILRRAREVAYKLALPPSLLVVHHVSVLRRYILYESHVISYDLVELVLNLTYQEVLVAIVNRQVQKN